MEQDRTGEYPHPKYLGVTLDRTLSYKEHTHNTKIKVATRNNLLRKLSNSKWGRNAGTIRTTALALCYSAAEYAAPVWVRSSHSKKLDSELNSACRAVTGCLKRYNEGDTTCECGLTTENTAHMMQCTLLAQPCSLDDLNDTEKKCVERWKTLVS